MTFQNYTVQGSGFWISYRVWRNVTGWYTKSSGSSYPIAVATMSIPVFRHTQGSHCQTYPIISVQWPYWNPMFSFLNLTVSTCFKHLDDQHIYLKCSAISLNNRWLHGSTHIYVYTYIYILYTCIYVYIYMTSHHIPKPMTFRQETLQPPSWQHLLQCPRLNRSGAPDLGAIITSSYWN